MRPSTLRRSPLARALLVAAAMVWAWTLGAARVHEVLVPHAPCGSHAGVLEVDHPHAASAAADHDDDGPIARATPPHDHGCALESVAPHEPPPFAVLTTVPRLRYVVLDPLAIELAPRGPPLAYAPKTSPPRTG